MTRHQAVQRHHGVARPERNGVSRRSVVMGAAWAAPIIVVATSIPAAAASPIPNSATVYSMQGQRLHPYTHLQLSGFQVQATGPYNAAPIDQLTFVVVLPKTLITNDSPTVTSGSEWQFTSVSGNATDWTFVFTAPYTVLENGGGTAMQYHSILFKRVPKSSNRGTATVSATGQTAGTTISVAFPGGSSISWN